MSIDIWESDGGLGNIINGWEIIKGKEFVEVLKEYLTQDEEKFKNYKYSLADYTATKEFDVSSEAISLIADYCNTASIVNPDAIVAIVCTQDLIYGLMRMWEMLSSKISWEKMVFRNREDAEAWIRERMKEKHGIDDLRLS
jgi:hypothetical protein